ncbi:Adipocyte plasma membrane-associated protein [Clonorchis sinensis]|uniref:Adipocyte plasma membrane-associated protein n=1 Tax=Clonorchis sinensis TaxID=79923 RepID=A0A419PWS5_CLOSI|nr:Adipocyte plasma membrane-associated protein [Clonorchis sinensis]
MGIDEERLHDFCDIREKRVLGKQEPTTSTSLSGSNCEDCAEHVRRQPNSLLMWERTLCGECVQRAILLQHIHTNLRYKLTGMKEPEQLSSIVRRICAHPMDQKPTPFRGDEASALKRFNGRHYLELHQGLTIPRWLMKSTHTKNTGSRVRNSCSASPLHSIIGRNRENRHRGLCLLPCNALSPLSVPNSAVTLTIGHHILPKPMVNETTKSSVEISSPPTYVVFTAVFAMLIALFLAGDNAALLYELTPEVPIPKGADINYRLSEVTELPIAPYHGPESIVCSQGDIYASVEEGKILKMTDAGIVVFADLHQGEYRARANVGRPLGMRLSSDGTMLLVIHSSLGFFSISLLDGSVRRLLPVNENIQPTFFDDFDVLANGTVILSEFSTKHTIKQLIHELLEGRPNGRLISVNPVSGEWSTMLEGLDLPNGVQLHSDNQSVLVAETRKMRILRVSLDSGNVSVFADGLPGQPDNIRPSPRGGYWVPVSLLRDTLTSKLLIWLGPWPRLRGALMKILQSIPIHIDLDTNSAMLLRLNDEGQIIEVWKDPKGLVRNVAEVCEHGDNLYTSSFYLPFIGKLSITKE